MTIGTMGTTGSGAVVSRPRRARRALVMAAVVVAGVAGCGEAEPSAAPTSSTPTGSTPTGAVVRVAEGSWDASAVPAGLVLAVVVAADDPVAARLAQAMDDFAADHGALVARRTAAHGEAESVLSAATRERPDLVVAIGADLVDALDPVSSQNLAQPYLVLGAQLPEPTDNVSAVVWSGATSRGAAAASDGALASDVTARRAADAVSAGLTRVMTDGTGTVLDLVG